MSAVAAIGDTLEHFEPSVDAPTAAAALLACAEQIVERWIEARGERPSEETREGFRLLALHRRTRRASTRAARRAARSSTTIIC
jgi:hypothetical protein